MLAWCGHCKHLAPVWEQLASQTKNKINIGSVDCTVHKNTCKKFNVQGYPTLIYLNGEFKENYFGGRNLDALHDFALQQIGKPSFKIIEAAEVQKIYEEYPAALIFAFDGSKDEATKPLATTMHSVAKAIKGKIPVFFW